MKKLFFTMVAMMMAAMSYGQNTLVATLTHGEDITMYYGNYALNDALRAAASGDIINLSGGTFDIQSIEKAITLRGTGIDNANPTIISWGSASLTINVPQNDSCCFSMEGIQCESGISLQNLPANSFFLKCKLTSIDSRDPYPSNKNTMFIDCKFTGGYTYRGSSTVQFFNCYLSQHGGESTKMASFINCILTGDGGGMFHNCVFFNGLNSLSKYSIATNCVAINRPTYFNNGQINPNCKYSTFENTFKTFTGTYSDEETFELTDEAKAQFLGTDGTEVGLYGGMMPYTPTPSYPQITKMNVANKTTADGKLSVEIEVSAVE